MSSSRKRRSGTQLVHDKGDMPTFDTVLLHSNLSSLRRKYLSGVPTDKKVLSCGPKVQKRLKKYATGGSKIKKENLTSGSLRGNLWQPLISPEAQERSCQFFSASHIGQTADCPFHRPAFFRPA